MLLFRYIKTNEDDLDNDNNDGDDCDNMASSVRSYPGIFKPSKRHAYNITIRYSRS